MSDDQKCPCGKNAECQCQKGECGDCDCNEQKDNER